MIINKKEVKIAVIGLGYVGLPLAVEFSKKFRVIGYDLNIKRIAELKKGIDRTNELSEEKLKNLKLLKLTSSLSKIKNCNIYIITVPTPVDKNNIPNLNYLKNASKDVSSYLKKGDMVIYESTVYPGCTEEICVPVLEENSNLKYNKDFFCGYSPERINPGDKKNTLKNIIKITSGSNHYAKELVDSLYNEIIDVGTYPVSSMAVAEAAKVIENTQRDVNIALVNELALIFNKLDIDTNEVLNASSTKWNFLPFKPGLVGGHCIGVDPYYLTHKAMEVGYHPDIILAGRRINDNMGSFIVENTISELTKIGLSPIGAKISILGLTFKEDCPDLRNSKVFKIIEKLETYKCSLTVSDYCANKGEAKEKYGVHLSDLNSIKNQDVVIVAVAHSSYKKLTEKDWRKILKTGGVIIDIKSIIPKKIVQTLNINYWSL